MKTRVLTSVTATFDASGNATASVGPIVNSATWTIENIGTTTTSVTQAELSVFRGPPSASNFVEGTYAGNKDSSNSIHYLANGELLSFVWSGGDPGTTATATLNGWQEDGY